MNADFLDWNSENPTVGPALSGVRMKNPPLYVFHFRFCLSAIERIFFALLSAKICVRILRDRKRVLLQAGEGLSFS
jgi:hypothetical protein